jgi:excisionase family DNA binding protein
LKTYPQAASALALILDSATEPSPLLSPAQAASYLSVEVATLAVWRCTGRYALPYVKVGRLVRYRQSDLDDFLKARSVNFVEENQ